MHDSILIGFMGDVMLGRQVGEHLARVPVSYAWGNLLPALSTFDLNIINLECALTISRDATSKTFNYKADPEMVRVLKEGSIEVVNLANNHILDFGPTGLKETLFTLDKAKIHHVGAGKNLQEAKHPVILEKNGMKIGILGCTDNEPRWAATDREPGVFYVDVATASLEKEISHLKSQVDLVILTMHWGPNMRQRPSPEFRNFAHRAVEQGVDIFHGHSAHIFQGLESYRGSLIFYDTGNFIDDYEVDPVLRNDQALLFLVEAHKDGKKELQLVPALISNFQVNKAGEKDYAAIVKRVQALSKELGTIIS